jgi:predicted nicotinamide N-methyase
MVHAYINLPFNRWNAALALASFLDANVGKYKDRHVLELGAGGALPSIVAAKNGARKVCRLYLVEHLHASDTVLEGGCHRLPR